LNRGGGEHQDKSLVEGVDEFPVEGAAVFRWWASSDYQVPVPLGDVGIVFGRFGGVEARNSR